MNALKQQSWERFQKILLRVSKLGLAVDLSRMHVSDEFLPTMEPRIQKAFADMTALESGAIANPDEGRMVGHYWLRNPALAPNSEVSREIEEAITRVKTFAADVHSGRIKGETAAFKNLLLIGIGGSALGPQFVAHELSHPLRDKLRIYFFDDTDPDGMHRVLATIGSELGKTLCLVVSKSGGTKETRNGRLEAKASYEASGLNFGKHAIATTRKESELDRYAGQNGWIGTFPMWAWVGKERDLSGRVVNQGICVFGNKSADQHSCVQQLRDCCNTFFFTFRGDSCWPRSRALSLTIRDTSAFRIGVLIVLFERSVGY